MKKIISVVLALCLTATIFPFTVFSQNITPEISLEEFAKQLNRLQEKYDGNFASEIIIEDDKEFCHIDGEEYPVADDLETTAEVTENDIEIPYSLIEQYVEIPEISTYSEAQNDNSATVDKEAAEALGFEVDIDENKAVLTQPYQTKRLIVKSKYNIDRLDSVAVVEGYDDLHIVQFDSRESAKQAEEYYNSQMLVEFAEPDLVMSTMEYEDSETESAPTYGINDYGYHLSWGSEFIGVDDYVDYIGDRNNLPEIVVGIIDSGIDYNHDFLKDRVIRTDYNVSSSGAENDENDDNGHGTHVAGIIADNTLGNVKIKAFKAMNDEGIGDLSSIITTFEYAVADGVQIINMSLGAKGESKAFEKSINEATKAGVIVCVSAGNNGRDASQNCPANIESCITVGAYDKGPVSNSVAVPYWTSYGPLVDIFAPGVSIYSTYLDNGYETLSGTSMACPFAVAASALLLSKDISLNTDGICDLLQENGKNFYWLSITNYSLYIATITEYNQFRTEKPMFSMESGRYSDSVTVELSCPEENAEIYYTLDGSRASRANGILYTEPIVIDKVTRVHAAAYVGDKLKSLQAIADYYITMTDSDGNFEIDTDGLITKYNGTNQYLTIPDTINGITVTGIGRQAFKDQDMIMMKFPDTLTYVADWGLYGQNTLKSVYCNNLKRAGERAFYGCRALEEIDLTQLEEVGVYSFGNCTSIRELRNEKLTKLEKGSFSNLRNAVSIDLPNVTAIGNAGLGNLNAVEYVNLPSLETMGSNVFLAAFLIESLDLPNLTTLTGGHCFGSTHNLKELNVPKLRGAIYQNTFWDSALEYIDLPNITDLYEGAFDCSNAKVIKLSSAATIDEQAFDGCKYLEKLYIPSITQLPNRALTETRSIKMLFAPSLINAVSMPECDGTTIYLSDACANLPAIQRYSYNIVAPSGSYAGQWASENGHNFIPSDSRNESIKNPSNVADLGRSICVSAAGLRFGFNWDNLEEIESLADNIEYGFVYSISGTEDLSVDKTDNINVRKTEAINRVDHGGTTSFNLVFANVPKEFWDSKLTARAYVNIDGMYFYSNVSTGSFTEVANLVLADDTVDETTKQAIRKLLGGEV